MTIGTFRRRRRGGCALVAIAVLTAVDAWGGALDAWPLSADERALPPLPLDRPFEENATSSRQAEEELRMKLREEEVAGEPAAPVEPPAPVPGKTVPATPIFSQPSSPHQAASAAPPHSPGRRGKPAPVAPIPRAPAVALPLVMITFAPVSAALDLPALAALEDAVSQVAGDSRRLTRIVLEATNPADPLTRNRAEAIRRRLVQLGAGGPLELKASVGVAGPHQVAILAP